MSVLKQKYLQQFVFTASMIYVIISMFAGRGVDILFFYLPISIIAIGIFISAYYHRFLSHRSWYCPRWLEKVLAFGCAYFGLVQGLAWVSTHRKHHRYSDTDKDPHGPSRGFITTLWLSFYDCEMRYAGKKLLKDSLYIWQTKYYWFLVVFGISTSFLYDPLLWATINAYGWFAQVIVNWFGHLHNKPTAWTWQNIFLVGELYHKHHHENPTDPIFGKLDMPGLFIRLMDRQVR